MLKYLRSDVVCQEIPDEISLAVAISGCQVRCKECHSRFLWEDKGEWLSIPAIEQLLNEQRGVTCLLLLGGEHDIDTLIRVFMHFHKSIKTAWYCGLDRVPKDKIGILDYLDFVKLGHFDLDLGGLSSPTTNQRLYQYDPYYDGNIEGLIAGWRDITYKFKKIKQK